MKSKKPRKDLKSILDGKIPKKQIPLVKRAFDIVGNIAIMEVPEELIKYEKVIAKTLILAHKNISTVLKKSGIHKGEFRTQKLKVIAGIRTKETIYMENFSRFSMDVEKCYFSVRLATERKRIFQQIKKNENILVMFCGVGPYPITISRNSEAKEIYAIEKNPIAYKYAEKNVKLNKVQNIKLFCGDVNEIIPKFRKKFDRILMPLPKSAEDFLDVALSRTKKGTIVHFYDFLNEDKFDEAKQKIKFACAKRKLKYRIISINKCGQHAPRVFRICVDFRIQ